ncbi:MAG: hypothetical protein KBA66_09135 [Leptospiraceae bacterium]|nr:hypothetical protein [Leptospiraceae bacterium]
MRRLIKIKTIARIFYLLIFLFLNCNFKNSPKLFGLFDLGPQRDFEKSFIFGNSQSLFTNEFLRTASFTVQLSKEPDSDVTIGPITSSDTTEGIIITNTTLTFTKSNFDQPQTITVQGVDDILADGNQQYRIRLGTVQTTDYSYSILTLQDIFVINTDDETPSIVASPVTGLSTNENGSTATISIVLSTQPGADVVIPGFTSSDTTECTVSGSLTFTSSNWSTPQTITVTGVNDALLDGPQNCLISSTASTSVDQVYLNRTIPVVTVINIDDDTAGFTCVPISSVTTEGGGQAQFSVVMNTIPTGTVTITGITTTDTTEGTISPANLTFTAGDWNTPRVMVVTGVDDFMQDGDINYNISFPNSVALNPADAAYNNLPFSSSAGSFTNQDNDARGVVITALAPTTSLTPLTVTEGGTAQTFQIRLTSAPCDNPGTPTNCNTTSITINLTNSDTSQYTISPSFLVFTGANWNTNQTVTVTAVNDSIDDGDLNFTLSIDTIVNTTDYNGINPSDIAILVIDNDTAGFTISPAGGITVNENDPGGVGLETTITVVLNSEPTGNVTLGSILSSDTLEAIVAPTIGGGNVSITNRTLVFTPTSGQAIVNSDSNSDTINDTSTGGWNVPQTIRVRAVVDGTLDGTQIRSISFGSRTTADTLYANTGTTPTPNVTVTNVDSGTPSILLQTISATSFVENGTSTITLQVALATLPTGNVTISNIVSSDTTEGVVLPNGGGAPITNRTLVFTTTTNAAVAGTNTTTGGWNMPQTITIRSVADDFDDGNIPFKITFTTATGAAEYIGLLPTSANGAYNGATGELTLTNTDNDTKGFTISSTSLSVTEGGTNGTFTVRLNSDPCNTPGTLANCASASVTINLTNNNTSQYTISPSSLTFASGTWNSAQTVTVTPVNDNYDENDMSFVLSLDAIVSTTDYSGLNPTDVNITVVDNDTRGINLTLSAGYSHVTSSGGGYAEYNLSLASSPTPGNTVTVTVSVPTAAPQEGKILAADNTTQLDTRNFTFTSANWSTNQTFRVAGITGSGAGNTDFTLTRSSAETGTLPPTGFTVGNYNNYNSVSANQTITNYHIGGAQKIRLAGATTTLTEASPTATFFWVMLNQAPVADLTINFGIDSTYPCTLPASVGSTKQFTVDTPSIVLTTANWNQITNTNRVQITSVNDLVDDGDVACPIIITSITSAGTDPYYTGSTSGEYTLPTITVTDNDTRGIQKQNITPLVGGDIITSRSGAIGTIEYSLASQPMSDVTISFSDVGGNASYSPSTLTFTSANYATWQTVTVTGNTTGATSDNNYTITATASSSETATGYANGAIYNTLTNTQTAINKEILYNLVSCASAVIGSCTAVNGAGGTVAATYTTTEAGVQRFFAISLRARPTSNVTIAVSSSDTTEGTVSIGTLTFTPANWNTLQVVTITGVNDFVADTNQAYTINFGPMTSTDTAFATTIPALNITNNDNDTVGFVLTPASETGILESNLGSSFTVRLNSEPTDTVSIPLSVNTPTAPDTGLTITSPTSLVFTTANWNTPQTVTFTWQYDTVSVPATRNHSVILETTTSTDPNYNNINPPDYTISITNSGL